MQINLNKLKKILGKCNLSKLTPEEIENLNRFDIYGRNIKGNQRATLLAKKEKKITKKLNHLWEVIITVEGTISWEKL